jgi:preprotein translocase subunit SecG
MGAFLAILLSLLAIFLILLVLVQRGRGGGLAGALGGMGGSSAFGAKAGDVFTRITIVTASIWIVLSLVAWFWANHRGDVLGSAPAAAAESPRDMLPQSPSPKGEAPGRPAETSDATSSSPAAPDTAPATQE